MSVCFLPGQSIPDEMLNETKIMGKYDSFIASQPGILRSSEGKTWLSVQSKRYIPNEGDRVLGIVQAKQGDQFKIDIGSADLANISFLNFEGATKRNRPNLKTGDIIYAKIYQTSKHLEPELTCIDEYNRAKGMGLISATNGFIFKLSLHLARRLLSPNCNLLLKLGKEIKFEITVGMNGRAWVNAGDWKDICTVRKIILGAEYILDTNISNYVDDEVQKYRR